MSITKDKSEVLGLDKHIEVIEFVMRMIYLVVPF